MRGDPTRRRPISEIWIGVLAGAVLAALTLLLAGTEAGRRIEGEALDLRFRLRQAPPLAVPILLVAIDEASIRELGRWPWSRTRIAEVVDRIGAGGARAIGLDLLFDVPEIGPADPDSVLARSIARSGKVVLPFAFLFAGQPVLVPAPSARAVERAAYAAWLAAPGSEPRAATAQGLIAPVPPIAEAAAGLGHTTLVLDRGGNARFDHAVVGYGGGFYPSFAIETARVALDVARTDAWVEFGRGVHLGSRFIPTDEAMRLVVNHRRPGRFPTVPFADVAAGRVDPARFADAIVLIGGTAAGVGDATVTPFAAGAPNLERHAALVETIVAGDFIRRRQSFSLIGPALLLGAGPLLGMAAAGAGVLGLLAALAALAGGTVALGIWLFVAQGLWFDLAVPLAGLMLLALAIAANRFRASHRRTLEIRRAFAHYLHPDLVERLAHQPDLLRPGGEEQELTILFADVRGFTGIAERLPAGELVRLMNDYFTEMTERVVAEGGMLDKYVGDGLIAVFGAPVPQADQALRACRAALAMRAALPALREQWRAAGIEEFDIGIGINTGPVVIGNLGSRLRFDYTVLGDEVNVASRLEALTRSTGVGILVSAATLGHAGPALETRFIDEVQVRGRDRPVALYELVGLAPAPATVV